MKPHTPAEVEICREIAEILGHVYVTSSWEYQTRLPDGFSGHYNTDDDKSFPLFSLEDAIEEMERRGFAVDLLSHPEPSDKSHAHECVVFSNLNSRPIASAYGLSYREAALRCLREIIKGEKR